MNTTYRLDGMVVRDQDNNYVCEIIAYEKDGLNSLLRTPEQLETLTTDRDIKAANLKTLVDMVLAYEAASDELCINTNIALEDMLNDAFDTAFRDMLNLARGLKQ